MLTARSIRVRGVVQGVGFRPFVYRLAQENRLNGWVLNGDHGVEIHIEGSGESLDAFLMAMRSKPPSAAQIAAIEVDNALFEGVCAFTIRDSQRSDRPTVQLAPDLALCDECLRELFDPADRRFGYPYINCTNCGPRFSVIRWLPYDRENTTMREWPMDAYCRAQYEEPGDRRFHAQPVACPECGPVFALREGNQPLVEGGAAIWRTAQLLREGAIVAIKGLGGYHLVCDARNSQTNSSLRERKFRKEKPFAVMAKDLAAAGRVSELSAASEALLQSVARPIVLVKKKGELPGVAPDNDELGVMLPYTPLHHLIFAAGSPEILVMTSANRSSEPIAYKDDDALARLSSIADAFLIGQRPIARRVDDSVVRVDPSGITILRRARGYAPGVVAALPGQRPLLALGADLKNTITLAVAGQALVSQHIGDLEHYEAFKAFEETIGDLMAMYDIGSEDLIVAHDRHPQYASTMHALNLQCAARCAIQHHRAHVASVVAETGQWEKKVVALSLDGTGYGDDGTIWGGEAFVGSVESGFARVAHLRSAPLEGGDAAAHFPVQAAAGYLAQLADLPDLNEKPFCLGQRYRSALDLIARNIRLFSTTSVGRLFDAAAALLGFTREVTFEGQAAMWLEQLAHRAAPTEGYPFPFIDGELDFRPLLGCLIRDRFRGRDVYAIARAFQSGLASGLADAVRKIGEEEGTHTVVLSGGVFQNRLLREDIAVALGHDQFDVWTNHVVPPNDGGISLGQAALAAFRVIGTDGAHHA